MLESAHGVVVKFVRPDVAKQGVTNRRRLQIPRNECLQFKLLQAVGGSETVYSRCRAPVEAQVSIATSSPGEEGPESGRDDIRRRIFVEERVVVRGAWLPDVAAM